MEFKVALHRETSREQWDEWVGQIDDATYHHSWSWIRYSELFRADSSHDSFILLENERKAVAVGPLGLTLDSHSGKKELSLNGSPLGAPAVLATKPSIRRQILDVVFARIRQYAVENGASRVRMQSHPLSQGFSSGRVCCAQNAFELQKFELIADVRNTLVMDLALPREALEENLSKYHRRHIRGGAKEGIRVRAFAKDESLDEPRKNFEQFQRAHFLSARRMTRPQATWDAMLETAEQGDATLFVAFLGDTAMSYLFCGEFRGMSFGWSQVNLEQYEREHSPRHVLEWEAILHYKERGTRYYDVGERFSEPQWTYQPSPKELTISQFKERYGGMMLPKIQWVGYLDRSVLKADLSKYIEVLEGRPFTLGAGS